jgi:hypothetical protein
MKDTNPPRESVSTLSFRAADATPTVTAPVLAALAEAALAMLAEKGAASPGGENAGDTSWTIRTGEGANGGAPLDISCSGPDLPAGIPAEVAHPSVIPYERPWVPTYRLKVHAPLIVLDLAWRDGDPLRIMTFSRGEWEEALTAARQ